MPTESRATARFSLVQRVRYRFDNALTRGISLILIWLGVLTLALLLLMALVSWIWSIGPNDEGVSFGEAFWLALTRTLDPGTFGADAGIRFRVLMLVVTLIGIFIVAIIIGLVSNSIDRRLDSLREGRSLVAETGHTLILGYSPKVPAIVRELAEANLSRRRPAVAILSDRTPSEVHDEIRAQGIHLHNTRLVVRRGNPASMDDLTRLNCASARSIIVVAPDDDAADSLVVKTTLALKRFGIDFAQTPAVVEVTDSLVANALTDIGGTGVLPLNPLATVARITARVLRSSGMGAVYEDMLDFKGDEIYTTAIPEAYVGRSFGELLLSSTRSTVIGIIRADHVIPVPDFAMQLQPGDTAIAISSDDSSLILDRDPTGFDGSHEIATTPPRVENTLIVGWSRLGAAICVDNENHVLPGSRVCILVDPHLHDPERVAADADLRRQEVDVLRGNPIESTAIDHILSRHHFDHVLVLAERDRLSYQDADARALLALLNIRRWYDSQPESVKRPNLVAELLDVNDEIIGEIARPDDFIVSERLVSLALAQLSENPEIYQVLRRLLDADGVQVQFLDSDVVPLQGVSGFADVVTACRSAGAIAIGIQTGVAPQGDVSQAKVVINPDKSQALALGPQDRAVVLVRT